MKTFDVTKIITIVQRVTLEAPDWESAEEQALLTDTRFEDIDYRESIEAEETS
jgi:hypothetical protein|tara:strand:- start:232 stop:390 length:159 start_codon:yes stop_codon:yes gene_type:complete